MSEPLFENLSEISRELDAAAHVLLCSDFDGTLAPIVPDPAAAEMPVELRHCLRSIASRRDVTLAVVSGRALEDLRRRVAIPGAVCAGNHGLEIAMGSDRFHAVDMSLHRPVLRMVLDRLRDRVTQVPGALVEDKGSTVTVHFRNVPQAQHRRVRGAVSAVAEDAKDLVRMREGRKVLELRPRLDWNKGSAVKWIRERCGHGSPLSCYLGDDETDEDAFTVIPEGISIRIDPQPETRARYWVSGPDEVRRFFFWLKENLERCRRSAPAASGR